MLFHPAQAKRLLRAAVLALLVLGLMIKPVLSVLSDLHAADHAMAQMIQTEGGDHDHAPSPSSDDHHADDPTDDDHDDGTHGLMHQGAGYTTLDMALVIEMPPSFGQESIVPNLEWSGLRQQTPSTPFRPPIV